jgi:hypothetical protein
MKYLMPIIWIALMLAATRPLSSQAATDTAAAREIAGCYAVHLGVWDQSLRGDSAGQTPPDTVHLDIGVVDGPLGRPGFRLSPHIEALTRFRMVPARWWLVGPDSVRLRWSSGFYGVTMGLARTGPDLMGTAEAFSDVIPVEGLPDGSRRRLPWPAAAVELRRIDCR